jgi:hypothetical protein
MWRIWTSRHWSRAALAGAVLGLGACSTPTVAPVESPLAEASALLPPASERALLERYPQLVSRTGNVLKVASRGGNIAYESECAEADDCTVYHLDRAFLDGRMFGISVGYYEGTDYHVADTESLHECTGDVPTFSPDNRHFAVAVYSEAYETCGEGVGIWATDFPLRKIRTVSPRVLTYPQALRWRGSDCLEFTAIAGEYDEAARRTYYLVKAEPEWRLDQAAPSTCRAG